MKKCEHVTRVEREFWEEEEKGWQQEAPGPAERGSPASPCVGWVVG